MDATDRPRTTRDLAIEGLRALARQERFLAAAIDEPGYYGRVAAVLVESAEDRERAADRLEGPLPNPPVLRLV